MPRLSLGLGIQNSRKVGGKSPIPRSGLSLWLKADAGVSKLSYSYASQIIISGTSTPNFNGTYTAIGTPSYTNGVVDHYNFSGPSGRTMFWEPGDDQYRVFLDGSGYTGGFASVNGSDWFAVEQYISSITITGFTGAYTSANVTYTATSPNSGRWENANGYHILDDGFVYDADDIDIAYNTNNFVGAWTLTNGTGSPTSTKVTVPDGSISGSATTSTVNTENVAAWADQSGNGRNATINTEGYGTYSLIGGKSFITFVASSNMIVPIIWDGVSFVGTIITVARFASSNTGGILTQEGEGGNFVFSRGIASTNAFYITTDGGDIVTSSSVANNNTNYVIGTTFNTSSASLYLNGTSVGTGNVSSNMGTLNTTIGDASSIAEMIVYNRVLTTPERQQVEAYLNTKYAIY
jgi:hypothetical protein